jgi:hypothetical protein
VWQIPDAVDTVVCASDYGWKYHPKHVEHFPDINKLCNFGSFWIYEYIGILFGAHPFLHISRIRVKHTAIAWSVVKLWYQEVTGMKMDQVHCSGICHRLILLGVSRTFFCEMKVKCTLLQALRFCTGLTAHRGSRGIALLIHDHGSRRGWGVRVTPRPLFTPRKDPVPFVQKAVWAPGPVWTGAENLAPNQNSIPGPSTPQQDAIPTTLIGPPYLRGTQFKCRLEAYEQK